MRSPEVSLAVIASFITSSPSAILDSPALHAKLLPAILVSCKSVTASTRAASLSLFDVLYTKNPTEQDLLPVAEQVFAPLKAGKTSSPDHRSTLFTMLGSLAPSAKLSSELVNLTLSLLPKESNDVTISAMMRVVTTHLPTSLTAGSKLDTAAVTALIRGMQEPKPTIRRAVCLAVGSVVWSLEGEVESIGEAVKAFGVSILPGFESGLKTVITNPLNAPAGPLEGFVAIASLKGRLGRWGVAAISAPISFLPRGRILTFRFADEFIANNPTVQSIYTTGAKPSFLLWDKVWRKMQSIDDEKWLTYALESVLIADEDRFIKDQTLRYVAVCFSVSFAERVRVQDYFCSSDHSSWNRERQFRDSQERRRARSTTQPS